MRILNLKTSLTHYEKDTIVLRDRITEFEGLGNNLNLETKGNKQKIKLMKCRSVGCVILKIYIHRASYGRHLKSKKHLEKKQQNKVIIPRKNPIKRVVKEKKASVFDTKVDSQFYFTDNTLKVAFNINIYNHH